MKVHVDWLGKDFHMEAGNEEGGKIRIDGNTKIGGLEGGISPMQLLLAGIGAVLLMLSPSLRNKNKS